MTTTTSILGIVPGLQATALVGYNLNLPKRDGSGRGIRANRGRGGCPIVKTGVTNFLGIGLIGATATMINKL